MNTPQETGLNPTQEKALGELISAGPPLWRLRLIQSLQIAGVLVAASGGADIMNLLSILSPHAAAWMAVSGTALRFGAEPLILLIGDLADDGIKNDSFKLPVEKGGHLGAWLLAVLCLLCLGLCSCAGLGGALAQVKPSFTPEGELVGNYTAADGTAYQAGPGLGTDGKVDRYVVIWKDSTGVFVKTVRYTKTKVTKTFYKAADGSWIEWSSKSGLSFGPPPAVEIGKQPSPPVLP